MCWAESQYEVSATPYLNKDTISKINSQIEKGGVAFTLAHACSLLACVQSKSLLIEDIKAKQYPDMLLCKIRDEGVLNKNEDFIVDSHGVLQLGDHVCVLDLNVCLKKRMDLSIQFISDPQKCTKIFISCIGGRVWRKMVWIMSLDVWLANKLKLYTKDLHSWYNTRIEMRENYHGFY